jgi:membrane-associated phospholipid phosphatase
MEPLDRRSRWAALAVAAGCAAAVVVLAVKVRAVKGPLRIDYRGYLLVWHHPVLPVSLELRVEAIGTTPVFATFVGALVIIALLLRDRIAALVALIGAPLSVILTDVLGKPIVGRQEGPHYGFPSGHTTATAALAMVAILITYRRWGPKALIAAPVFAILPLVMLVSVVQLKAHLFTDAVAGVLVGAGVVLAVAGVVSLIVARVRRGTSRPAPSSAGLPPHRDEADRREPRPTRT